MPVKKAQTDTKKKTPAAKDPSKEIWATPETGRRLKTACREGGGYGEEREAQVPRWHNDQYPQKKKRVERGGTFL